MEVNRLQPEAGDSTGSHRIPGVRAIKTEERATLAFRIRFLSYSVSIHRPETFTHFRNPLQQFSPLVGHSSAKVTEIYRYL